MARGKKRDPLPDAVRVTGKATFRPPVAVGMACQTVRSGFPVTGRIVGVLDPSVGEVLVMADPGQDPTVITGIDGEGPTEVELFTPGQPFTVRWGRGLESVQRADGRWEGEVLEVVREKFKAIPGWQLSDAVRCDPAYRNRVTGGGVRSEGGRFAGRGENGQSVDRRRWTTTLTPEALDVLRTLAEQEGINRNEVVERLLLSPGSLGLGTDEGAATVTMTFKVSEPLEQRISQAAASEGMKRSAWLRRAIARLLP